MRLRISELDGGSHFHGYVVDDNNKWLFDVGLVQWYEGIIMCHVRAYDTDRVYSVNRETHIMKEICPYAGSGIPCLNMKKPPVKEGYASRDCGTTTEECSYIKEERQNES